MYDSDEPVLLFRRFRAEKPYTFRPEFSLVGSHKSVIWPVGEPMTAKCVPYGPSEPVPCVNDGPLSQHPDCRCGLHGYYTMDRALDYCHVKGQLGFVVAVMAGGGRVLFDNHHARCSVAEVVCLIDPREYAERIETQADIHSTLRQAEKVEQSCEWADGAARRYEVPLLPLFEAMEYAHPMGRWVEGVRDTPEGAVVLGVDDF